jgi:hypothetical protein
LREIADRATSGDKSAPLLRDQVIGVEGHMSSLIGDAHTTAAVEKAITGCKTLGEVMNLVRDSKDLALQLKVVVD